MTSSRTTRQYYSVPVYHFPLLSRTARRQRGIKQNQLDGVNTKSESPSREYVNVHSFQPYYYMWPATRKGLLVLTRALRGTSAHNICVEMRFPRNACVITKGPFLVAGHTLRSFAVTSGRGTSCLLYLPYVLLGFVYSTLVVLCFMAIASAQQSHPKYAQASNVLYKRQK